MGLHYCSNCGTKLQPDFKYCSSCGQKLPCPDEPTENIASASSDTNYTACLNMASVSLKTEPTVTCNEGAAKHCPRAVPACAPRHATRRKSTRCVRYGVVKCTDEKPPTLPSPTKRKAHSPEKPVEEPKSEPTTAPETAPTVKGRTKKAKRVSAVEPVPEGAEFTDQSGQTWKLVTLLRQTETELTYGVKKGSVRSDTEWKHILKLGAKEGPLFIEQNLLQRAARPATVDKWVKRLKIDFLGIPSCVGFGLHEAYRFLIFPDMGQTLQSVIDETPGHLSEKAVLQLSLRLLDALEFIHENEYVHADIHAGNIYVNRNTHTLVFLSGFGRAFRFCPAGKHVEYLEGSRNPHLGNTNFLSLDSHKGAGPSCRSDLQSLGYCMLYWMTGALPWSDLTHTSSAVMAQKERYMKDVSGLIRDCLKKKRPSDALQGYLSQVMALQYCEKPDYQTLRSGLTVTLTKLGGGLNQPLDL